VNILIVHNAVIPARHYGGIERVIWALGKKLVQLGHKVSYLVPEGSECPFAQIHFLDPNEPIEDQIPEEVDLVHAHFPQEINTSKAVLHTIHGNAREGQSLPVNSIFVSANHAARHGSKSFVYNGLDWNEYAKPNLDLKRHYFHFLGNAAWGVKNVKGAITTAQIAGEPLKVLGGTRLNFRMGFRFTPDPSISFYPKVNDEQKGQIMSQSRGLVFPVRWHEPFGLAVIESLYFGCPIFTTPYGAFPEIVDQSVGFMSSKAHELAAAMKSAADFSPEICHAHAVEKFNAQAMAKEYLKKYEEVLNGNQLNDSAPKIDPSIPSRSLEWNS